MHIALPTLNEARAAVFADAKSTTPSDMLAAVRRLHAKTEVLDSYGTGTNWRTGETTEHKTWRNDCLHCRRPWPCPTAALVN